MSLIDIQEVLRVAGVGGGTCQPVDPNAVATIPTNQAPPTAKGGSIKMVVQSAEDETDISITIGPQFIIKNTTGIKTPVYYTPGSQFSRYSRELIRAWTGIMTKLHQICNRSGEFSVGFCFDDESEAECEQGIYGRVYYINPVKIVTEPKRGMVARYTSAWHDRYTIIANACHEFVHGAYGLGQHDEDYAYWLTEVMAVAMANYEALVDLCRPPVPTDTTKSPVPITTRRKL